MANYKWMLRKGGKKERCPQCGRMRFVPFVLTADPSVKAGESTDAATESSRAATSDTRILTGKR